MKHIKIFENFYDQQMRDEQENASKNIKTENSEIKVGTLGVDRKSWSDYSRDVWGEEFPVSDEQMEIFNSDPYNFEDKKVKFELVDGKAVVKLKQVTKYEVE